jgi:hypothetical protein
MKPQILTCFVSAAILTLGSSVAWAETDCSNAKADIAHLQHEKKSTDERKVKGVLAILPIGLVVNAVSSDDDPDSNKEMEINEYNQKIDDRIAEIQQNCNL